MKGRIKMKKKKKTTFYSLCNYCMTHNGPYFPFWQHTQEISFVFMSLPLGMHEQHYHYTETWLDCLLYICTLPSTDISGPVLKDRLVTYSDQQESIRGISEPCRVFNMEIGFELHLHRSAHLWAKLCYCWQGKWTINSL